MTLLLILVLQEKPPVIWEPAHPNNYYVANYDRGIWYVIIHTIEGNASQGVSWFQTSWSNVSTHFLVDYDGTIYQAVAEKDIGRHTGNSWWNAHSIGIEHAGFMYKNYWTDAEYKASAKLTRYLCLKYGIPMDRQHILGHDEATRPGTDPGPYFNWTYYMSLVKSGETAVLKGVECTASALNVRTGPSTANAVMGQIASGQRYVATAMSGGWFKIHYADNAGWCHGGYLQTVSGTGVKIETATLNVRTGPGTGYAIVGTASSGRRYVRIATSGSWQKIWWGGGASWVHGGYASTFGF